MRAVELAGRMYLFGTDADGAPVVAVTAAESEPDWSVSAVSGLPAGADLGTVQLFRDVFYAVADGDIYSSVDGIVWSFASAGAGAAAIVGASDADGKLWIAGEQGIYFSENGSEFTFSESLPVDFPLYGISLASYPLNHNKNIIRYMLVGYANEDKSGEPEVWSRLSTEDESCLSPFINLKEVKNGLDYFFCHPLNCIFNDPMTTGIGIANWVIRSINK